MKLNQPWLIKTAGLLSSAMIRAYMSTLDYRVAFYDPTVYPSHPECHGQKIYLFWHEYILPPVYICGHLNVSMLLSRHTDAEILSRVALHTGFGTVRGSTNRGNTAALKELFDLAETMNLTITPDGPRGPRRSMAQGAIYLASRLQIPIVCLGLGLDRPWRLRSWDRFAIPRPFSRVRAVTGPQLHIPENLSRDGIEHYRGEVERLLNRLTLEAEAWAESRTTKREEQSVAPRHDDRMRAWRFDPPHASPQPYAPPWADAA